MHRLSEILRSAIHSDSRSPTKIANSVGLSSSLVVEFARGERNIGSQAADALAAEYLDVQPTHWQQKHGYLSGPILWQINNDARPLLTISELTGVPYPRLHDFWNCRSGIGIDYLDLLAAEYLQTSALPRGRSCPPEPTLEELPRHYAAEKILKRAKAPLTAGEILSRLRAQGYRRGNSDRTEYETLRRAMERHPELFHCEDGKWSLNTTAG